MILFIRSRFRRSQRNKSPCLLFTKNHCIISHSSMGTESDQGIRIPEESKGRENMDHTQHISIIKENGLEVTDILAQVYEALSEKGYNPVSQIVGYIMSGDPTYITSYKGARSLIMKAERDEIIEVLLENYIETRLR